MPRPAYLYLHGLFSRPNQHRTAYLTGSCGVDVIAPCLDYSRPNLWARTLCTARALRVAGIVGMSMGGYLGWYLAQALDVPALLFNPALAFRNFYDLTIPAEALQHRPEQTIVLGLLDDTIPPATTREFLAQTPQPYYCYEEPEMPHRTPDPLFQRYAAWWLGNLPATDPAGLRRSQADY